MGIRADDAVPGGDQPLLRKESVLNAHFAHVVKMADAVAAREFPALLALLRRLDVLVGDEVVKDDGDLVLVEHLRKAVLCKLVDGHRGGDVVAQNQIQLRPDELPRRDGFQPRVGGENLLCHCHTHNFENLLFSSHVVISADQRVNTRFDDIGVRAGAPAHIPGGVLQANVGRGGGAGIALLHAVFGVDLQGVILAGTETPDMNCNKVIEALLAGLEKGKRDFGIEYGVITCAMRHHSEEENARMLRTAREYLGHGVCAADLAGAESLYPMSEFMELFKKTKALGMPFTLHAGECGSVQNILDSVETGAGRIGHGIAMRGYADVQKELQKKGIGIEMCPISNLQTKAVESTKNYPMREFLNAGLKVTVNTDNRTVSNTTLTKELEFIQKNYRITDEEIHLMMRNAVDVAFADDAVKERMLKYV